jgi:hypothetical protein
MIEHARGEPGIPPTWTTSAKDMVGCALHRFGIVKLGPEVVPSDLLDD